MPAQRAALSLIELGLLRDDSASPLEAVYEGPGKTIGYRVPPEFPGFERQRSSADALTWVESAAQVALTDPIRSWTVGELVDGIRARGLRDLTSAKTPEATLRRDLTLREQSYFLAIGDGAFRLREQFSEPQANDGARD